MSIQIKSIVNLEQELASQIYTIGRTTPEFLGFWEIETIHRMMCDRNGLCIIATNSSNDINELVGFSLGTLQTITNKFQWENLWVHKKYRRNGIGISLTEKTITTTSHMGAKVITADVLSDIASNILRNKFDFKAQSSFHYLKIN
jgi:ribosomal protein S18 acetylase RimI-like enzyme